MAAHLLNVQPGDEVIMPSYTFTSTANAFVMKGAIPVFVDIRSDTLNLDETLVEAAITPRTKALVAVHYAGVSCEMDHLIAIANRYGLAVVEDAAQGMEASYRGRPLGSLGALGALSFHETKNVTSGEGGALLIQDRSLIEAAEILSEKGTNRSKFFRGQVDKYTWIDVGSSYLPGEMAAAFLYAQLSNARSITDERLRIWRRYHEAFNGMDGVARRPVVPPHCTHNAHMYYLLLPDLEARTRFILHLRESGIQAVFHYSPLHSSPAGLRYGRTHGTMGVTDSVADRLVRLPLWVGMGDAQERVVEAVMGWVG
jgi:dTDP-4-amino-4,6-dideoxygalactose transaminase